MTRKPKPHGGFAPRPPIYPLGDTDLAVLARWHAEGRVACGTCQGHRTHEPMTAGGLCYCDTRCVSTFPWSHQFTGGDQCPSYRRRESTT